MIDFESPFLSWLYNSLPSDEQAAEMAMVSEREEGEDYGILTYLAAYEGDIPESTLDTVEDYEGATPDILELIAFLKKK